MTFHVAQRVKDAKIARDTAQVAVDRAEDEVAMLSRLLDAAIERQRSALDARKAANSEYDAACALQSLAREDA